MAVRIEKLISGGRGLAHLNGKSVFVSNALPQELVELEILEEKKNFIDAEAKEIIEASPYRIVPPCPYYGLCGGCDFQIVSPEISASLKEEIVKDNLRRIAELEELPEFLPPAYGPFEGYRSRARIHVDLKSKVQGFLAKGSNKLVPIKSCLALEEKLNELLAEEGGKLFKLARMMMFENKVNRNTGYVEIPVFSGDRSISFGSEKVDVTLSDYHYKVSSRVFFQSNRNVLPALFSFVLENTVGDVIMDLYSGVGTFSALFENSGKTVYAVERQKECLELSRQNAPSAISYTSDVFSWAKKIKQKVDTVIVDPPRVGLEEGVPKMISSWNPERIIYISCNSVTASRDIPLFEGYKVIKAQVFDFYPGTGHEESAVVLSRID